MSRIGTPLRALVDITIGSGSAIVVFFTGIFKGTTEEAKEIVVKAVENGSKKVTEAIKTIKEIIPETPSLPTVDFGIIDRVNYLIEKLLYILYKIPVVVKAFLDNLIVFFYIFCFLIVIGQFDWLLEDFYTLIAISAILTYITYR